MIKPTAIVILEGKEIGETTNFVILYKSCWSNEQNDMTREWGKKENQI